MMQDPSGITFYPTGISLVLGAGLVAATGALCWIAWRRTGCRKGVGILELLRFVLVCLILVTLCQPEWLETRAPDRDPTLAVLWDRSNSMHTRDVLDGDAASAGPRSRAETIEPLLSASVWKPADTDLNVVFEPFSSLLDPAEEGTDLNAGLLQVLDRHPNLRGVVVLSDGDWNVGRSPIEAATRFRMKEIPVYGVGVGSDVPLPDLALVRMDAPTFGVVDKPLRIPFVIRSTLGQDRTVEVALVVDGEPALNHSVRVPAMEQVQDSLVWTPTLVGDVSLAVRIPRDEHEWIVENNERIAPISVRQEKLNVLVVESYPRWEYRYLRNALERDPGVEVACLLFHPALPKVGGGRSYIEAFPTANELSRFDVVVLGDVGLEPKQLTVEQIRDLRHLVSAQAAGLVLMPGRYGYQETLTSSPLGDLVPVVMESGKSRGHGSDAPGHFTLTQAGQRSLLTRLADTDSENARIWKTLPGFYWYAGVERARAGAEILAVHSRETTAFGRVPLIVTRTYGTGKVLFMGTDSAWRWREGVEDRYHYRFWGQVARWMAYQRQMAAGQAMRLFYSPDRPRVDDLLTLNANVLDHQGGPLDEGTVVVQAVSPSGKTETIHLQPGEQDAWGLFFGSFVPNEPGRYRLVAGCAETGASVETDLTVQGLHRERQGRMARIDVLEEIAAITQGTCVPVSDVSRLWESLADLPEPDPTLHRTRLWAHPAWGGILLLLMVIFWTGRKVIGAV